MKSIKILTLLFIFFSGIKSYAQDSYQQYKIYFDIELPRGFSITSIYGENSNTLDYSDYNIHFNGNADYITTSTYGLGRVGCGSRQTCFEEQLKEWEKTINITYKIQKDDWFVISGVGKNTGRIFYLRGSFGERYMSTLRFAYPPEDRDEVEKYLPTLSKSFQSK